VNVATVQHGTARPRCNMAKEGHGSTRCNTVLGSDSLPVVASAKAGLPRRREATVQHGATPLLSKLAFEDLYLGQHRALGQRAARHRNAGRGSQNRRSGAKSTGHLERAAVAPARENVRDDGDLALDGQRGRRVGLQALGERGDTKAVRAGPARRSAAEDLLGERAAGAARAATDRLVMATDFTDATDHHAVFCTVRQASRRRPSAAVMAGE